MRTIFIQVKCGLGQAYRVADEAVQAIEEIPRCIRFPGNMI